VTVGTALFTAVASMPFAVVSNDTSNAQLNLQTQHPNGFAGLDLWNSTPAKTGTIAYSSSGASVLADSMF
jgi:hypothetical protein